MSGIIVYQSISQGGDGSITITVSDLLPSVSPDQFMFMSLNFTSTGAIFKEGSFTNDYIFEWSSSATESPTSKIQIGTDLTPVYPSFTQTINVCFVECVLNGTFNGFQLKINAALILTPPNIGSFYIDVLNNTFLGMASLQSYFPDVTDFSIPISIVCYHENCYFKIHKIKNIFTKKNVPDTYKKITDLHKGDKLCLENGKKVKFKYLFKFPINTEIILIKIKKNAITSNIPSYDIYVTMEHMFFYDNKKINASELPFGEKIKIYVDYLYHIVVDKKSNVEFVNCSNMYTDVWGVYNKHAHDKVNFVI